MLNLRVEQLLRSRNGDPQFPSTMLCWADKLVSGNDLLTI
jgi:hypothetical protein